jgi:hypothetical protein
MNASHQLPPRSRAARPVHRVMSAPLATLVVLLIAALLAGSATGTAYGAAPPTSTSLPTITGIGRVGETLTADDGTFAGVPDPTLSRQWERCDRDGGSCSPIDSETSPTYTVVSDDVGGTLRVAVTATNSDAFDPFGTTVAPAPVVRASTRQLAGETTNDVWSLTVLSDPIAVLAAIAPVIAKAPAVVPARTILSLSQPHVQCTTLARLIEPGTPGPLVATGALTGTLTIRAARRPVLLVATRAGQVRLQAARRVLGHADGVGALGWTERSSRRLALLSSDGRLLIAVGRNAHHPTLTVIKSRLCTTLAPALEHIEGRADQPVHATVYATGPDGTPLAQLLLAASVADTSLRVRTDAHGQAEVWLPAGGRRDVHVDFAGDATHAPATLTVPITAAATSTLSLVSGTLPAQGLAEFAGRLAGRDGTPAGSRITLSYQTPGGRWRTVGSAGVDQHGRWTLTSPPPRVPPGRPVVAYRVCVEPGPAYPYLAAVGPSTTFHITKGAKR